MTRLKCGARNCDYNKAGVCSASNILIEDINANASRDTYCATYIDEDGEIGLNSIANNNYMMNMMSGFPSSSFDLAMSPDIICNATNCRYNLNRVCVASDVLIYGEANGVRGNMCDTFINK